MRLPLCRFAPLCAFLLALPVVPLSASVLYDNGPISGHIGSWVVDGGHHVINSFQLSSASTITGIVFGAWGYPGRQGIGVDWAITSSPFGTPIASGESELTNLFLFHNSDNPLQEADIWQESFAIPELSLGPGTYWLELDDTWTERGLYFFWDQNNGPSQAQSASRYGTYSIGSESFQILGSAMPVQATPEPGSAVLLGCGALLLGVALIGKRRVRSSQRPAA